MRLSETACEILDIFRQTHRRPGARMTIAEIDDRLGTDPAVAVAVSELTQGGYLVAPDDKTVELTPRGFDALQRGDYRGKRL
jgi:Mn-dependent DtxR family transcriptional regulator